MPTFPGKAPNYRVEEPDESDEESRSASGGSESGSESQGSQSQDDDGPLSDTDEESDPESSPESDEEDEEIGSDGVLGEEVQDQERPAKRVKTENSAPEAPMFESIERSDGMLGEEEQEMPAKRVKTENCAPEVPVFEPIERSQKTIKREPDDQTDNDVNMASCESPLQSSVTSFSSDDSELPAESNTVCGAGLKLVYDVEYQAPE